MQSFFCLGSGITFHNQPFVYFILPHAASHKLSTTSCIRPFIPPFLPLSKPLKVDQAIGCWFVIHCAFSSVLLTNERHNRCQTYNQGDGRDPQGHDVQILRDDNGHQRGNVYLKGGKAAKGSRRTSLEWIMNLDNGRHGRMRRGLFFIYKKIFSAQEIDKNQL